jgi:hypothetical protein
MEAGSSLAVRNCGRIEVISLIQPSGWAIASSVVKSLSKLLCHCAFEINVMLSFRLCIRLIAALAVDRAALSGKNWSLPATCEQAIPDE